MTSWQEGSENTYRLSLEWPVMRRRLVSLYAAYVERGAPEMGVDISPVIPGEHDGATIAAEVRELVRGGYLDVTFQSAAGPRMVRPTRQTLQMLAGWPGSSAQDALNELVAALDSEIAGTAEGERRSKLVQVRDGLLGAAQQIAIAYLEKKIEGM